MHKSIEVDLVDAVDSLEHLLKKLHKLPLEDRVDVGARVRGIGKAVAAIDDAVKADIAAHLKGKAGNIKGDVFQAVLNVIPTTRLSTSLVKEDHPEVYSECCVTNDVVRISYEPRG